MWHAVYRVSDGALVSIGTVVADQLPEGLASKQIGETRPIGDWDRATAAFVGRPVRRDVIKPREFWQRFTQGEREALHGILATGTQPQRNRLNAFILYVSADPLVDLNDAYVQTVVSAMEQAGILSAGRAAIILGAV